jgi:hypothetical protein
MMGMAFGLAREIPAAQRNSVNNRHRELWIAKLEFSKA